MNSLDYAPNREVLIDYGDSEWMAYTQSMFELYSLISINEGCATHLRTPEKPRDDYRLHYYDMGNGRIKS
jgi:hypothetical protein